MADRPGHTKRKAKAGAQSLPRAEVAYQQIKKMLLVRELVPDQKLRYQDIAKKIQVSQTPVILALTRLENEGLVTSQANKGFFVPKLDLDELAELYDMRILIETHLAGKLAKDISDEQLAMLRQFMDEHQSFHSESYTMQRLWCDAKLHLALASLSGNQVAEDFLRRIFDRIFLRYRPEHLTSARMQEAEEEHEQIWEALRQRSGVQAAKALRGHIRRGKTLMLAGLRQEAESRDAIMPWA